MIIVIVIKLIIKLKLVDFLGLKKRISSTK